MAQRIKVVVLSKIRSLKKSFFMILSLKITLTAVSYEKTPLFFMKKILNLRKVLTDFI